MIWIFSRSTSSWILVRACAGTPPLSPTNSSTLRPASVLLRSFRYWMSARSMSMPPEASGPVFTVMRPSRIGPACALTGKAVPSETAPTACTKRLRFMAMTCLLSMGGRARLLQRVRFDESVDLHALLVHAHHGRHRGDVAFEIAGGADHLPGEADVGEGWRIAMTEAAGFFFAFQMNFNCLEGFQAPMHQPGVSFFFI